MNKLSNIMPDSAPLVRRRGSVVAKPSPGKIKRGKKGKRVKGTRIIEGLISAAPCERPRTIPESKPRGKSKREGLKYERQLALGLPSGLAKHGQWFAFVDRNGSGYCQTDLVLEAPAWVAVLEAKLTWTAQGHFQIEKLYKPVLQFALRKRVLGVVVAKSLTTEVDLSWVCRDLESALHRAALGLPTVLHWLGTSLGPLQLGSSPSHLAPKQGRL